MGLQDRRKKEKAERKELILSAALKLVKTSGVECLTMRKLADMIEYSPCILYETFPKKDAIIRELFSQVCKELLNVMRAVPKRNTPEEYFKKLIWSDIEFMTKDPCRVELFLIVSMEASRDFPADMNEVIHLIGEGLRGLGYRSLASDKEIEDAQDILRTFLAGLLRLFVSQKQNQARCKRILENGLNTLLKGWAK